MENQESLQVMLQISQMIQKYNLTEFAVEVVYPTHLIFSNGKPGSGTFGYQVIWSEDTNHGGSCGDHSRGGQGDFGSE